MKPFRTLLLVLLAACSADLGQLSIPAGRQAGRAGYFPADYAQSRRQFARDCALALASRDGYCRAQPIASGSDTDLAIDYAYFAGGGPHLLVVQSGIHGVEAYAGAAVQQLILREHLARLLDRGVDVLLVHALNPYGFKHHRRTDEFNVNLNRNFSADDAVFQTVNQDYADLRGLFEPAGAVGSVALDSLGSSLDLLWAYVEYGFDVTAIGEAMNQGQYQYERGLNFGGRARQPQTAFLEGLLRPLFAEHPGRILFLDVHTGLGEAGALDMIAGKQPSPELLDEVETLLGPLAQDGMTFTTGADSGFFATEGDVIDFVPLLADDRARVLALTMEFGTLGTDMLTRLGSANRVILENQAHFNGCTEEEVCREVEANFRELFNPPDPAWRAAVLAEADRVIAILGDWLQASRGNVARALPTAAASAPPSP